MNKKICVTFIFGLLILPLILSFAMSLNQSAVDYSNSIVEKTSTIAEAGSNFFGGTSDSGASLTSQWAATGKQWKDSLMANPTIHGIDSFFQSINFVFLFLFGINYSLSLGMFLTIALWLFFFFSFRNLLKMSLFSKGVCLLISLGLTVILSQIGLFSMIVNFIIQFFFGEQTWWMKVIIGILILFALVLVFAFIKRFGKQFAETRKKMKDAENRIKLETGAKTGEALSKAISKTGKS